MSWYNLGEKEMKKIFKEHGEKYEDHVNGVIPFRVEESVCCVYIPPLNYLTVSTLVRGFHYVITDITKKGNLKLFAMNGEFNPRCFELSYESISNRAEAYLNEKNKTPKSSNKELCLKEVALRVARFLKENGGYENGYDTFIEGSVSYNTHSSHEWYTPTSDELTGRQKRDLSYKLNEELLLILKKYKIDEVEIVDKYIEEGCHKIYVVLKEKVLVDLWGVK